MVKVNDIIINTLNNRHCSTKFDSNDKGAIYLFLVKPRGSVDSIMQGFSQFSYPGVLEFCKDHDVQKNIKREQYFATNVKNAERQELRK